MPLATRLACRKHPSHAPRWTARAGFSPGVLVLLASVFLPLSVIRAQRAKPTQYEIEAVYLFQFGKFVQWPPQSGPADSFEICVLGRDPFGGVLDKTVAGEKIANVPLKADRIVDLNDARHCRILYVSPSEDAHLDMILATVSSWSVLTVSDLPDFESHGGMIQFMVQDNRVRFEINVAAARKVGLNISSQLLKVAAEVRDAPPRANP